MRNCIQIEGLSKRYRIGILQYNLSLREQLVAFAKHPFNVARDKDESIWALRNISFRANEGDIVGIVGRNGAGKSTLLKILARITHPTSGNVKVEGRVASLLEVGTGFHDELTGRENIYLNGSILGMRKREVDRHFDEIVAFSGVEQFIDTPIKRYSSGMRLRLGFAVAAHLDPDVLIVDEVLAVGDAAFQKKCIQAMEGLRKTGRTVLFVSHNLAAVEHLCSRGIWIDAGQIRMDGRAKEIIEAYMGEYSGGLTGGTDLAAIEKRVGSGEIRYTKIEYLNLDGTQRGVTKSGDGLLLRFHYHAEKTVRDINFGFVLYTPLGTLLTWTSNWHHRILIPEILPGDGYADLEIGSINLVPGTYNFSLWLTGEDQRVHDKIESGLALEIDVSDVYDCGRVLESRWGVIYFPQRWRIPALQRDLRVASLQQFAS
jgi:lipopolysaccharide transport system ATP-binding protein